MGMDYNLFLENKNEISCPNSGIQVKLTT
jgi:hypothetical protein